MQRNSNKKKVEISVIIPTLNEEEYLENCLKNLESDLKGKLHEIIIVDGNSTDRTLEVAKTYKTHIIRGKNPIGAARQAGLKAAKADIVAFIDADSVPEKGWSSAAINALSKPGAVMAFGPAGILDKMLLKSFVESFYNIPVFLFYQLGFYNIAGYNMIIKKDAALRAGGFNPKFSVLEDVDFAMRMKKQGKVVYNRRIFVRTSLRRFNSLSGILSYFTGWLNYLTKKSTQEVEHKPIR
jgi:glycosyltransferase involved in cell wall biosynthesis